MVVPSFFLPREYFDGQVILITFVWTNFREPISSLWATFCAMQQKYMGTFESTDDKRVEVLQAADAVASLRRAVESLATVDTLLSVGANCFFIARRLARFSTLRQVTGNVQFDLSLLGILPGN